jgi:hypothetical protein
LAGENDRIRFLQHFTNLAIVTVDSLKVELMSLFGGWVTPANIWSSALKGGPCGLLGLYNSLFTNFLDNYDTALPDFEAKRELLTNIATKLTQCIKDKAHTVRLTPPQPIIDL